LRIDHNRKAAASQAHLHGGHAFGDYVERNEAIVEQRAQFGDRCVLIQAALFDNSVFHSEPMGISEVKSGVMSLQVTSTVTRLFAN
jgi:hypothetical protein